ncbi:unnamed protein product [Didymodactylos carnosus]|uniref:Proteasomal ATPase-associated factor 1 n=1 Tax=Didymodactylos carnosus TaxID=1234261 RepID=A0A814NSZ0_9BILA|nr:unnamed protein product [Didymodactylos carnosus]CAF3860774.1 unnamed protein product [Didymodactylos carnosus]
MSARDGLTRPRIEIQPDWFDYVQNKQLPVDVYVNFKPGSIHLDLTRAQQDLHALLLIKTPNRNESTIYETSVSDHFETSHIEHDEISIKLKDSVIRHTFKGPKRMFKPFYDSCKENKTDTSPLINIPELKNLPSVSTSNIHPNCLDINQDGLGLVGLNDGTINIFNNDNGDIHHTLKGHAQDVYTARFFPSNHLILSGGGDFLVKIWSLENDGECRETLTGHTSKINDLAIIGNGEQVVSISDDGSARLWNLSNEPNKTVRTICQLDKGINNCSLFESTLACACADGYVRTYDINQNNIKATSELKIDGAVNCVCYKSDYMICGTEQGIINVYDVRQTNSVVHSWKELRSKITSLTQLDDDGGLLVTTGDGSTFYHSREMLQVTNIEVETDHSMLYDVVDYTGPKDDIVLNACVDKNNNIYTVAGDGYVRIYDKVQAKK